MDAEEAVADFERCTRRALAEAWKEHRADLQYQLAHALLDDLPKRWVEATKMNPPKRDNFSMSSLWKGGVAVGSSGTKRYVLRASSGSGSGGAVVLLRHKWRNKSFHYVDNATPTTRSDDWALSVVGSMPLDLSRPEKTSLARVRKEVDNSLVIDALLDNLEDAR